MVLICRYELVSCQRGSASLSDSAVETASSARIVLRVVFSHFSGLRPLHQRKPTRFCSALHFVALMLLPIFISQCCSALGGVMALVSGRALLDKADAVSTFLKSLEGTSALEVARPQQVRSLMTAIAASTCLSLVEASSLIDRVTSFTFLLASEKEDILQAIDAKSNALEPAVADAAAGSRKVLQDYTVVQSFTASMWAALLSAEMSTPTKLQTILMHCCNIGL